MRKDVEGIQKGINVAEGKKAMDTDERNDKNKQTQLR